MISPSDLMTRPSGLKSQGVSRVVALTQAEYDAIPVKDETTLYIITD